jgi:hypothetical protein
MERITEWWMRIGLAVLFAASLMFWLAVAHAEAADVWISWYRISGAPPGEPLKLMHDWEAQFTYPDAGDCQSDIPRIQGAFVQLMLAKGFTASASDGRVDIRSDDGGQAQVVIRCFPDTIDPRRRM